MPHLHENTEQPRLLSGRKPILHKAERPNSQPPKILVKIK